MEGCFGSFSLIRGFVRNGWNLVQSSQPLRSLTPLHPAKNGYVFESVVGPVNVLRYDRCAPVIGSSPVVQSFRPLTVSLLRAVA